MTDHRFMLEIYEPDTNLDASFQAETDSPWPTISVGDLINPYMLPSAYDKALRRVTNVEHLVWQPETSGRPFKHKVMVFTTRVAAEDLPPGHSTPPSAGPEDPPDRRAHK